jgi:hypothetical protein
VKYSLLENESGNYRLGIETKLDHAQEQIINHYILQRQIKLIRQIRDLSENSDQDSI